MIEVVISAVRDKLETSRVTATLAVVAWVLRALTGLGQHLNVHGRPRVGTGWRVLASVVAPAGLAIVLVLGLRDDLTAPYGDYPTWLLLVFGWLMVVALPLVGFLLARVKWRAGTHLDGPPPGSDPAAPLAAGTTTAPGRHS